MKKTAKTAQLQIRVSPREKALISRYARRANMGISEWVLSQTIPPAQKVFQGLAAQLQTAGRPGYVLAEIHDLLKEASADELERMVSRPPSAALPPYLANYLAAMVEYALVGKGRALPLWVHQIPALEQPVFGSDLENLRLYLLTHSPPPFRRRNIFIDSTIGARV